MNAGDISQARMYVAFDDTHTIDADRGTGKVGRWFEDELPAEARAAAAGAHLSGHGGTEDGIIGAAAAVGLTADGWLRPMVWAGRPVLPLQRDGAGGWFVLGPRTIGADAQTGAAAQTASPVASQSR